MKSILLLCAVASAALSLSSCSGECNCNSYNRDYLRDVPVNRTRSF